VSEPSAAPHSEARRPAGMAAWTEADSTVSDIAACGEGWADSPTDSAVRRSAAALTVTRGCISAGGITGAVQCSTDERSRRLSVTPLIPRGSALVFVCQALVA
jgi:hypothetical protein